MSVKVQEIDPAIERGFDLRARHPRHADYKNQWRRESAATRSRLECTLDISCGHHTDRTFDMFPAGPAPGPCFVFLHGGFWRSSDKSENSFVANAFEDSGITTIVMNYRLVPAVTVAEIVAEISLSVINLFEQSSFLGFDQNQIHIGGFSAGGLLAAQALSANRAGLGNSRPVIRAGMALSGIFDPQPLLATSHNRILGLTSEQARALSVVSANDDQPKLALVACGAAETQQFKSQTNRYANAASQAGCEIRQVWLKGRHHYDVILEFAKTDSPLAIATRQMIRTSG